MFVRGNLGVDEGAAEKADVPRGSAFTDVPVVPANDLRGRLRRCAARQVFEVLLAKNSRFP